MNDPDPYEMKTTEPTLERAYRPSGTTLRAAGYALFLMFVPHRRNSPTRKYVTTLMFATWAGVTFLRYLGFADAGPHSGSVYWAMTVVVFSIMSHMWGFEYGVLSAVTADERDTGREPEDRK